MAQLDLSEVLLDPLLFTAFVVVRRPQVITGFGEVTVPRPVTFGPTPTSLGPIGVITAASPNDLMRGENEQHQANTISVVTRFPLRGEAPGTQPDLVKALGNTFVIVEVNDYSEYGAGFVQAQCRSIQSTDTGAEDQPPSYGELIFSDYPRSQLIAVI